MTPNQTDRDTTIEDIHRTRVQMAAKFGDDIAAILDDARKRQEASGRTIWQGSSLKRGPQLAVAKGEVHVSD